MSLMLEGLTVIDFTNNIAGPVCSAMLAERGAEVIHIEKPVWGDDSRHYFPTYRGTSCTFDYANRNKKSLALDVNDPAGVEILKEMAKTADIFLESNRPGVLSRRGLGYEDLKALNPRLIYCSISAFGQEGPYREKAGYDVIAQAYSGMLYYTGSAEMGPTKNHYSVGDYVASYNAYGAITTALYHRERTGRGQFIDVPLARGLLMMNGCLYGRVVGFTPYKTGNKDSHLCPYGVYNGPNGSGLVIAAVNVALWGKLCAAMERPELAADPRFITNDKRVENQSQVTQIIESWLASFDRIEDAAARLDAYGVPNLKAYDTDDILDDPHAQSQGWIREIPLLPSQGGVTAPMMVGSADYSEGELRLDRAPEFGEHTEELLRRYGMSAQDAAEYARKWLG